MTDPTPQDLATTPDSFEHLGLSEDVLKCVRNVGFTHPTPIQKAIIPPAIEGKDVIGLAQTGSGKTAAFVLPLAERLTHGKGVRGLILCPTREIALQTQDFITSFGKGHGLTSACLIGGVRMPGQIAALKKNPDVVVATPGRMFDMMERRHVRVDRVEELVLDEADHMMDMGFLPQIRKILSKLPEKRHTMMFSATMPFDIENLARRFLRDPLRVDITPPGKAAVELTHQLYFVKTEQDKELCLKAIIEQSPEHVILVFTRRKVEADWLTRFLTNNGIEVEVIHSDRSQQERTRALSGFREGKHRILIATDIASRGIDVPGIHHIVNFDVPESVEDYIHRSGRTARAGKTGTVSTIATWPDKFRIKDIEKAIGMELPRCTVPGVEPYVEFKIKPEHDMRRKRR